jgi:glyoxylase-like metal-dependent hydrolase (beta-lactamase superfamily II)
MLLAGDMVASTGSIIVEPRDGDMVLYLASLRQMRRLQAVALLPAHGELIADATSKLDEYVAHRLGREAKVLLALRERAMPSTAADLVPMAYVEADPSVWPLAALSTEAHLIKLETDGLVARTDHRWVALAG